MRGGWHCFKTDYDQLDGNRGHNCKPRGSSLRSPWYFHVLSAVRFILYDATTRIALSQGYPRIPMGLPNSYVWFVAVALFCIPTLSAAEAPTEPYESENFDYSVTIPDGWEVRDTSQLPPQIQGLTDQFKKMVQSQVEEHDQADFRAEMDLVMGPAGAKNPVQPPFAIFMAGDTPKNRSVSATRESLKKGVVNSMKSAGLEPNIRNVDISKELESAGPRDVLVDTEGAEVAASRNMGARKATLWVKVGARQMVAAYLVGTPQGWSDWSGPRTTIQESFKLDEQAQIDPEWAQRIGYCAAPFFFALLAFW